MTAEQIESLVKRTTRSLRRLTPQRRAFVMRRLLESDPELTTVVPTLLAVCATARLLRLPLHRDSVM